jgi:hypothetical protein
MSNVGDSLTKIDHSWPRWLTWAFIIVLSLTSIHWVMYNGGRLNRGESLLVADGVKYYSYLPSILLQGSVDFSDEFEELSPKALEWIGHGKGPLVKSSQTGLVKNVFPIGAPVLWAPFFLTANLFVHGDGLNPAYQLAVLFGSLVYGLASLALTISILRRFFAPALAFFGALLTWAGGFIYYYSVYRGDMSHAPSVFMVTLVLWLWLRFHGSFTWRRAAMLGIASGMMILVRPQNALVLLVPIAHSAWHSIRSNGWRAWSSWAELASRWALVFAESFIIFLPQLVLWAFLFGAPSPPMTSTFFQFGNPFLLEILFSRNGIVSFTPLLGIAIIGLFLLLKKDVSFFLPCLSLIILLILLYSISGDWWCGESSFGIRRFADSTPFLALGMAAAIAGLTSLSKKYPGVVAGLLLAPLLLWNFLSMQTISDHQRGQGYFSLSAIAEENLRRVRDSIGWPLSLPGSLPFALTHRAAASAYDSITGRPVDRGTGNLLAIPELLVEGWQEHKAGEGYWVISGSHGRMVFAINRPNRFTGEIRCFIRRMPPPADDVLMVELNGRDCGQRELNPGRNELVFRIPENGLNIGVNELVFRLMRRNAEGKLEKAGRKDNILFRHISLPRIAAFEEALEEGD